MWRTARRPSSSSGRGEGRCNSTAATSSPPICQIDGRRHDLVEAEQKGLQPQLGVSVSTGLAHKQRGDLEEEIGRHVGHASVCMTFHR